VCDNDHQGERRQIMMIMMKMTSKILETSLSLLVIGSAVIVELVYWSPRKHDKFHPPNTLERVFFQQNHFPILPMGFITSLSCIAFINMHSDRSPGKTFQSTFY